MTGKYLYACTFRSEKRHSSFTFNHPLPLKKWTDDDWAELLEEGKKEAGGPAVPVFLQQLGKERNGYKRFIFRRSSKGL